jgi:splicing factor 3A subunit 1
MTPFGGADDDEDDYENDGEPAAKKRRLEDDLEPEETFLAKSAPQVKVIVQVLGAEARGVSQTITLDVALKTKVNELKSTLNQNGCSIPLARIKLVHSEKRYVLKDSNTLAFYNLATGVVLEARTQERGGRKK